MFVIEAEHYQKIKIKTLEKLVELGDGWKAAYSGY